ncbi:telomere repeat binding factor-domain-containing protein [Chaetomium sp. MPI-CAGE-AT-0009]|nr:telomere repeat binding factor-domain-containing protein [Chaetomium sp. MPI-CAGE-AT-0009]
MADTSELEAELLAALGVSAPVTEPAPEPAPNNHLPTEGATTQPQPHERQPVRHPAQQTTTEPLPTHSLSTSPAPPTLAEAPTPSISSPAAIPTTTVATAPTATTVPAAAADTPLDALLSSALEAHPAPEPNSKLSSPPVVQPVHPPSQTPAPSRTDAVPQKPALSTPAPPPQETPGIRSPKRLRSPDSIDESSVKRQRMADQTMPKQEATVPPANANIDFAAMLNDALANFDQHALPEDGDIVMQDANVEQPAAPASTISDAEKAENKIMKASSNPFYVMRSMSLPVLGNIAVQILLRLSQQPRTETESLLADSASEFRRAYDMLRDIFRPTRKAFSASPLLSPDELDITDSEDRETIRMSNLAATAASVFGAHDVAVNDVHDAFFSIFIPEDGEYKSPLTDLLVSLKTRMLLDALNKTDQSQPVSQLLDALFPINFEESLKQRSGDLLLNPDEEGLVARMRERREQLVKSAADESMKRSLEDESSAQNFTGILSVFLQSHLGVIVDYAEKYGVNIPLNEEETAPAQDLVGIQQEEDDSLAALLQSHFEQTEGGLTPGKGLLSNGAIQDQLSSAEDDGLALRKLIEESLSSHIPELKETPADPHASAALPDFDSKNLASFISEKLKNELDIPTHGLPNLSAQAQTPNNGVHPQYMAQLNQNHASPYQPYSQGPNSTPPAGANGDGLPPNQSMPTAALYERARQAAVAKSSNTTRREGLHSTRRPWTPEEEKALMAGLDMVKGPHWSQILSLFGPQGTISDILKDRTQVQLKDKARNLKLFFLKTNSEMPYYLQSVTGELKTRAPGQAARKEAEEKARMNVEEERARVQGIITLAGGLQNNHHPASNTPLAASPPKRASPGTPGFVGLGAGSTSTTHMATGNGATMQGPPRIKTELPDQHSLHKVTAFPPIQPAPAPGSAMQQQTRAPLPSLQPQPGLQQQPRPQPQQPYQQPQQAQQPQQPRQQTSMPTQQQQQQPQQQQQQRQPLPQHQQQAQQQSQSTAQPQPQSQQHQQGQPLAPPQARAQSQATQQQSRVSPPTAQTQPLPTPPIPPNHHSTPDHAQDAKLFETLQAAIAASAANETHTPLATAVSEGSATMN